MRKYIDRQSQELTQLRCNKCGREIKLQKGVPEEGVFHGDCIWGYFSRKDGEIHSFDLCEDCYDSLIRSFKLQVEVKENHELV